MFNPGQVFYTVDTMPMILGQYMWKGLVFIRLCGLFEFCYRIQSTKDKKEWLRKHVILYDLRTQSNNESKDTCLSSQP